MKVYLTGATGFVGRYLVRELLSNNCVVCLIVRNKDKIESDWHNKVSYIEAEMSKYDEIILDDFEKEDCVFIHMAWNATSGNGRSNVDVQLDNIQYSCAAVRLAKRLGCRRFIYAGSIMEYDAAALMGVNENVAPTENMIYSIAKMTADLMCKTECIKLELEYVHVIISNIYGVGEKSERFLNSTLRKMINGEKLLLSSCEQRYDFIYATDAVHEIYLVTMKGKNLENYYIGNPKIKFLKEYVLEMKGITKSSSELVFGAIPIYGSSLTYEEFDINKIEREFGYTPKISFEDGISLILEDWENDK